MALKLPKQAEKKRTGGMILEDAFYKVRLGSQKDDKDTKESSKRFKYSFHNMKFIFENNKGLFARVYYQNDEGDIVPEGFNFLLSLRNVLEEHFADDEAKLEKIAGSDSNRILNTLIKYKIPFYIATRKSLYNGEDITNINTYVDAVATLEKAEEEAETRKLSIISLAEEKEVKEVDAEVYEEDEDDL